MTHVNNPLTVCKIPHSPGKGSNGENRELVFPSLFPPTDLWFRYRMTDLIQPALTIADLRHIALVEIFTFAPVFFHDCQPWVQPHSDIRAVRGRLTYGCRCVTAFHQPQRLRYTQVVRPYPFLSVVPHTFGQRRHLRGVT